MLFAVICDDKSGALDVRTANRPAHLAYLDETGVVVQAGPFLDEGGQPCGSLVIIDVPNMEAALAWAQDDPYALAGLFGEVAVRPWRRVVG